MSVDNILSEAYFSYNFILSIRRMDKMQRIELTRNLITKEQLLSLTKTIDLSILQVCQLVHVTDRSIHLKKNDDKLNMSITDRAYNIAYIYSEIYDAYKKEYLITIG